MTQQERHAVPRLYKIDYLEVALTEVAKGSPFERIRQGLIAFAATQKGEEQMIVSRIRDAYTLWSPTQEALAELMRLGFLRAASLPSERKYVDAHRASTYELTTEGSSAVNKLTSGDPRARADFLDLLSVALAEAHPGFADLLALADQHPLCIPEYTIEGISSLMQEGRGSHRLAHDAISRMSAYWPEAVPKPRAEDLASQITEALARRFPRSRVPRPSQKDVLDTVNDAILGFAARARNIRLDPISFNVCMSWASQLALLEESRYVEGWPGRTVWATARIYDHQIYRRGFRDAGDAVVEALAVEFKRVAKLMPEAQASGYIPIHRVRACAAFSIRVNLRFVNMVLKQLLSGQREASYTVQVALGRGTRPPPSEPVFTHQGRRFFELMITGKEKVHAADKCAEACEGSLGTRP